MTNPESINIKKKQVQEILDKIKNSKTLMIISIKSLPSKQFQNIKKSLRGKADVKVAKKNIVKRVIEGFDKPSIKPLKEHIDADCAIVTSNLEGYELAGILMKNKTPVFAKAGQIAPDDIEVKAGPTDLVPGPAISELGSLGIQVAVEDGKISIKADKIIVTKGEEIKEGAASLLQKLNIQPFSIGLVPLIIYDIDSEKIYTEIKIDPEETTEQLKTSASKALGFAQKIVYFCKETIGYFLAKANAESEKLNSLQPQESTKEEPKEESTPSAEETPEPNQPEEPSSETNQEPNTQLNKPEETA